MSQKIGYNDGIEWLVGFLRKFPLVKYRPVGDRPVSLSQWYGLEKLERTLRILKDDHDAAIVTQPPGGGGGGGGPAKVVAPRTYNKVLPNGSDARFCIAGLAKGEDGLWHDSYSGYDDNGLDVKGGRSKDTQVEGLRQANNMNGMDPCTLYDGLVAWPAGSYEV